MTAPEAEIDGSKFPGCVAVDIKHPRRDKSVVDVLPIGGKTSQCRNEKTGRGRTVQYEAGKLPLQTLGPLHTMGELDSAESSVQDGE